MFNRLKKEYLQWKDKRNIIKKIKNVIYNGELADNAKSKYNNVILYSLYRKERNLSNEL